MDEADPDAKRVKEAGCDHETDTIKNPTGASCSLATGEVERRAAEPKTGRLSYFASKSPLPSGWTPNIL
jgi:hypothetical protein